MLMGVQQDVEIDLHLDLLDDVPWLDAGEDHAVASGMHGAALELAGSGFELSGVVDSLDSFDQDPSMRDPDAGAAPLGNGVASVVGCTALLMAPPQQQHCAGLTAFQAQPSQAPPDLSYGGGLSGDFVTLPAVPQPDSELLVHKPASAADLGFGTFLPLFSEQLQQQDRPEPFGMHSAGSVGTSDSAGTGMLGVNFGSSSLAEASLNGGAGPLFPQSPAGSDDRSAFAGAFSSAPQGWSVVTDNELLGPCGSGLQFRSPPAVPQPQYSSGTQLYLVDQNGVLTLRTRSTAASCFPPALHGSTAANALAANLDLAGPVPLAAAPPTPVQVSKRRVSRYTRPRQQGTSGTRGKPRTDRNSEAGSDNGEHLHLTGTQSASSTQKRKRAGCEEAEARLGATKSARPGGVRAIAAVGRAAGAAVHAGANTDEDDDPDKKRKQHNPWDLEETEVLIEGVERCGSGRWADIKKLGYAAIERRSAVDLKDKWRNLVRVARQPNYGIKPGPGGDCGEAGSLKAKSDKRREVPIYLLERVRAAMEANPKRPRNSH